MNPNPFSLPQTQAKYASVHTYLGYMLASAMGLKMADNLRRISLYARPAHHQRTFFAFARGIFPLHELCAALTAMQVSHGLNGLNQPTKP